MAAAEGTFAALATASPDDAFNDLQYSVQDEIDVHRVVLAWRAWATARPGRQGAGPHPAAPVGALLRRDRAEPAAQRGTGIRAVLPKLLDQYKLPGKAGGKRKAEDEVGREDGRDDLRRQPRQGRRRRGRGPGRRLSPGGGRRSDVAGGEPAGAARPRPGRRPTGRQAEGQRPRRLGRRPRLGLGQRLAEHRPRQQRAQHRRQPDRAAAYHTAGQSGGQHKEAVPARPSSWRRSRPRTPRRCCRDTEGRDQGARTRRGRRRWSTATASWSSPERPVFDLLLRYAVSEDGALHAEKYYRTVTRGVRGRRGRRSAGGSWWRWPASRPASTASRRRATPRRAGC